MDPQTLQSLTYVIAPIVMVQATGLLFNGLQTKGLHLSERIRTLAAELRNQATPPDRREQVRDELALFHRRIRLTQRALQLIQIAIICFVMTSLLLAVGLWIGQLALTVATTTIFVAGVFVLVASLVLEFVEIWIGLRTLEIEMQGSSRRR